jgi:hypothetical protein
VLWSFDPARDKWGHSNTADARVDGSVVTLSTSRGIASLWVLLPEAHESYANARIEAEIQAELGGGRGVVTVDAYGLNGGPFILEPRGVTRARMWLDEPFGAPAGWEPVNLTEVGLTLQGVEGTTEFTAAVRSLRIEANE